MNTAQALIVGLGNLVAHPARHKSAANDNYPVPTPPSASASFCPGARFRRDVMQGQRLCRTRQPYGIVSNAIRRRVAGRCVGSLV
jgi:hypothetical protein